MMRISLSVVAAACCCALLAVAGSVGAQSEFAAVARDHWAYAYCDQLSRDGLLLAQEWPGGSEVLTRGQFAILVSRALGRADLAGDASMGAGPEGQADASILRLLASEFGLELQRVGWSAERIAEAIESLATPPTSPSADSLSAPGSPILGPLGSTAPAGIEFQNATGVTSLRVVGASAASGPDVYGPVARGLPSVALRDYYFRAGTQLVFSAATSASLALTGIPAAGVDQTGASLPRMGADASLTIGAMDLAAAYVRSIGESPGGSPGAASAAGASEANGPLFESAVSRMVSRASSVSGAYPPAGDTAAAPDMEGIGAGLRLALARGTAVGANYERYRGLGRYQDWALTRLLARANMSLSERFLLAFDVELRSLQDTSSSEQTVQSGVTVGYDLGQEAQIRLRYQVQEWRNPGPEQQRTPAAMVEMTVRL